MSTKKRNSKKKSAKGGIASYVRKINNVPAVKKASGRVKKLESELKGAKKKKAQAIKAAQKNYRKKK